MKMAAQQQQQVKKKWARIPLVNDILRSTLPDGMPDGSGKHGTNSSQQDATGVTPGQNETGT
jgi:hypothetical protein